MIHNLKCDSEYFEASISGAKPFEVRFNDRNYLVGDILLLNEYHFGEPTGEFASFVVTYVLDNADYCKAGFVVLGIRLLVEL